MLQNHNLLIVVPFTDNIVTKTISAQKTKFILVFTDEKKEGL